MLVYFMSIRSILRPLETFCGHLIFFVVIWFIFLCFGMLYQEKSGNPDSDWSKKKVEPGDFKPSNQHPFFIERSPATKK
jgi:hypothetical protein